MALRKNTKRYTNTTSLGASVANTKTLTHADTSSAQAGYTGKLILSPSGFKAEQKKTEPAPKKDAGFFGWLADPFGWNVDKNPTVNPVTVNNSTNFHKNKKALPTVLFTNHGASTGANSDVITSQNGVTSMPDGMIVDGWQWQYINGKYVKVKRSDDQPTQDPNSNYASPAIPRLDEALARQQANMDKINQQMQANLEQQKAYTDHVNTSLMSEINGLYEANGKQNELNDLIIESSNQKWMTQLGDEIVPIQSQNAFKEPLPLKTAGFDVSSITGSKYFIFIVVGIIGLIALTMLKGKGAGAVRSAPMSVRYG